MGTPKITLSIAFGLEEYDRLEEEARKRGISKGLLIRTALQEFYKRFQTEKGGQNDR